MLIALVIIGIVAAITVPVLFASYQEQAVKSALKKNYSILKQALDRYQIDNCERLLPSDVGEHELKSILIKYLNVMYDCGMGYQDVNTGCISGGEDESDTSTYRTYNNMADLYTNPFDDGQFVLTDGSLIMLENVYEGQIYISVDVNGVGKKPNRLGKDLFMFQLVDNGELLPMGASGTNYSESSYCSNTSTGSMNGAGCTNKVLNKS